MKTLKSCSIDDQYKHVSFKDLEGYLAKDDYMSGYCEAEKELIRKNLGIETYQIDSRLSDLSANPVENQAITKALSRKADIDKLPKVAITGDFEDLCGKPKGIPNPEFLVIDGPNGTVGYNGSAPVKVEIPTHISELVNDVGYLTDETFVQQNYVKGIQVNMSDIIWPEQGIIHLDIPSLIGIDNELSLTSHRPVQNKVVTRAFKHIHGDIIKLNIDVKNLKDRLDDLKLDDLADVSAQGPKNGQMLAYVQGEGCKGQWELTPKPEKEGDILVFDGNTWKVVNLLDLIKANSKCLWKINDRHQLIPDESVIRNIDSDFNGEISTRGAIYSGSN
jgi:hypothetical protein